MSLSETTPLRLWVAALIAWEYGAPEPLAKKVRDEEIPAEMLPVLADIVGGKRKPKPHVTRLKIRADQVGELAEFVSRWLAERAINTRPNPPSGELENAPDRLSTAGQPSKDLPPLHWPPLAEDDDLDHAERRARNREQADNTLAGLARIWEVSPKTLKRLANEYDRRLSEILRAP
jgi:hypothetical protein